MHGPVMELNLRTPKGRNVRRKLVQSTLVPHKTQESDDRDDKKKDDQNCCDEQQREEEARCCVNEKNKRKSRGKVTPPTKNSKQNSTPKKKQLQNSTPKKKQLQTSTPRKKQTQNRTPKKKLSPKGVKGACSRQLLPELAQINTQVHDLWSEAKKSAEENSRMFAGRQIHPFFSTFKVGKKFQDPADSLCAEKRKHQVITYAPIHVFENIQASDLSYPMDCYFVIYDDDPLPLNWRNWTFLGQTVKANCWPQSSTSSVFEGSVEPLKFDKLPTTFCSSGASISQNVLSCSDQSSIQLQNLQDILPENSDGLASGRANLQTPEAKVELDVDTEQASIIRKSDPESKSRFLKESMKSYYQSCGDKTESSLWTYKYKPTKAFEVCGNDESVNILRDWLHLWHERCYRSRNDSADRDKSNMSGNDDDDYDCSHSDYDSEDITEEDSLENVLLITGPTGSGKSAAVYACAQEEGFDVLELSTSDFRNGTAIKRFGDTLGSKAFKRSLEETGSSQKRKTRKLSSGLALPSNKAVDEFNGGEVELIPISDDEAQSPIATSQRLLDRKTVIRFGQVRTLILFEDVDILFPEDRGCIHALQQIALTAKGPIILTSNSNKPVLPDNLNRLCVSFSLPSPDELLCHLHKVCVTEGVDIQPFVLDKFIQSCDGDIRKTIMHLQFWFQSRRLRKERKAQTLYGSLPFDLEVGHQILPKMIPWDLPSQLSELIEKEVTKVVTIMEDTSCLHGLVEEQFDINDMQNGLDVKQVETDYIEAKKVEMLERNGSIIDYNELETQFLALSDFANSSGTPVAPSKRKGQRKLVVSSDSEDEDLNNGHPPDICDDSNKGQSLKDNTDSPSKLPFNQNYTSASLLKLGPGLDDSEAVRFTDDECLNEISKSFDVSCVPESTFVPETVINGTETISGAVSCGHHSDPVDVSVNKELLPFTFSICKRLAKSRLNDDLLVNTEISESSQKETLQDLTDENIETTPVYNVMDECSRVDFRLKSKVLEPSAAMETDVIHNLWRELGECRPDLRQHAATERLGTFEVVKLTCGMSNLISEADLFSNYQQKQCDILEPPASLFNEATFNCYDDQMVSTVAEHGFCFYAKHLLDMGLKLGHESSVDLASEMLASTTNITALGNLSRQGLTKCTNFCTGKELEVNNARLDLPKSTMQTSLYNVIQSIVPARLSLAMKGAAFNEYLSSLRHISRAEAFRLSQGVVEKTRRRSRMRGAQHYLSSGKMMLSPEDISSLCEGELYRKISSL
ncbi:ATPase family AAA domain-containing protein 5 [Senna tora]|uniref:ATPase family AAA domain-containing protein 5 n=1 Tax=Senna tora TaxID=362788 RepID=A0A834WEY4_9FABA|nr:ATPase family AAA domain-containing protein 5 [Senna tora]